MKYSLAELLLEEEDSMNTLNRKSAGEKSVASKENDDENKENDDESKEDESKENDEKLSPGAKLSKDDLISDDSSSHIEIQKAVPKILAAIKRNPKINKMQKRFQKIDQENPSEEDVEFLNSYAEEVKKGDSGDGLLDISSLKILFSKSISLGAIGKGSLNPAQMKKNSSQMLGVTANDIKIYKKLKMIPFFLNVKSNADKGLETVSGHKGNKNFFVVFVMPAFGAVIENDSELNNYKKVFPKFSQESNLEVGSIIVDTDEIPFCYVDGEKELGLLQSNFVAKFVEFKNREGARKSDGRESEEEETDNSVKENKFIYKSGISFLLHESNSSYNLKPVLDLTKDSKNYESGLSERESWDFANLKNSCTSIVVNNYSQLVNVLYKKHVDEKKLASKEKQELITTGIEGASDVAQGILGGYMAYLGGAAVVGLSLSTAGAGLALLPYAMGAKVGLPALAKGAGGISRAAGGFMIWNSKRKFKGKNIDEKLKSMFTSKAETGEFFSNNDENKEIESNRSNFNSIDDESDRLTSTFSDILETVIEQDNKDRKVRKDNKEIEIPQFETACNKNKLQLTMVNDIPKDIYLNFLIDCNEVLRQFKLEIAGMSKLSTKRKTGLDVEETNFNTDEDNNSDEDNNTGEDNNPELSKADKIKLLKDILEKIPDDDNKIAVLKALILYKIESGDEDKAFEMIEEMILDGEGFTRKVQEVLENEEDNIDQIAETACQSFNADPEIVAENAKIQNVSYITSEEFDILKALDFLMCTIFGIDKDTYNKKSAKKAKNSLKDTTFYKTREGLEDQEKNIKNLFRPTGKRLEPLFSFALLKKTLGMHKADFKVLKSNLLLALGKTIDSPDQDFNDDDSNNLKEIKTNTDEILEKMKAFLTRIDSGDYKEKISKAQRESARYSNNNSETSRDEGLYYNTKLKSLLFESSLKNLNFDKF